MRGFQLNKETYKTQNLYLTPNISEMFSIESWVLQNMMG